MATAVVAGLLVVSAPAQAAQASGGMPAGSHRVTSVRYDLGDRVFVPPPTEAGQYEGANELAGVVYYPTDLAHGRFPLVMIQHGLWDTCADRVASVDFAAASKARDAAEAAGDTAEAARQQELAEAAAGSLRGWPCAPGIEQISSKNGYEYLARQLAAQGFVVVSIGANGINATSSGQAPTVYRARAALLNRHLAMWQQLSATGGGELAHHFTDPRDGRPRRVDFRGRVDLTNVGTVGHSMGGGGVMQQAADMRRDEWPAGVTVKGVFTLAPTGTWDNEPVTQTPFAVMWGTCDAVNTGGYFEWNGGRNTVPIHKFTVRGANHTFFNTQWSPGSGQVGAQDDAVPGSKPGTCLSQDGRDVDQVPLTETAQRSLASAYASAFFRRYLRGESGFDPILAGTRRPPGVPADVVDARVRRPLTAG
ncbi:alpha/beta hydrolase [Streptomyces sp. SID3343]|uniref:alpha/beta hydrolase n=1 Tax=Streptomyces sp. SID3343 TaxID=2690260 RepID=UPI00136F75F4|nr:alpha/beta hydrolase [Streptomyces sp. SID3343]MYV99326.1 alpha/beta hydrolase [Streptomyces sp. SID3343]